MRWWRVIDRKRGLGARLLARRRWLGFVRDRRGTVAIEFSIVLPALLLLVLGALQFGLTLNNYVTLTNAVGAGARQLSISRGDATPYTDTKSQITGMSASLTTANIAIALSVNGVACASDAACQTALAAAEGTPASVTASYPCNLDVMVYNFAPNCTLTSQMTVRIE